MLATTSVGPSQKTFALLSSPECILPRQPCPAADGLLFLIPGFEGFESEINAVSTQAVSTCSEHTSSEHLKTYIYILIAHIRWSVNELSIRSTRRAQQTNRRANNQTQSIKIPPCSPLSPGLGLTLRDAKGLDLRGATSSGAIWDAWNAASSIEASNISSHSISSCGPASRWHTSSEVLHLVTHKQ